MCMVSVNLPRDPCYQYCHISQENLIPDQRLNRNVNAICGSEIIILLLLFPTAFNFGVIYNLVIFFLWVWNSSLGFVLGLGAGLG